MTTAAIAPPEREIKPKPRWTLKRLKQWIQEKWGIDCCRETIRRTLHSQGFSWKKAKKLLNKGNSEQRANFLETITKLLDDALHQKRLLIYIDEAHIHLDTDEGYGWSIKGERFWVSSSSPGRKKVSCYGVYLYNQATTRIFPYEKAEKINTVDVLKKLREEVTYHICYDQEQELIDAYADFQNQINTNPLAISDRLWVKKHLEPEEEKLRFSK